MSESVTGTGRDGLASTLAWNIGVARTLGSST